MIKKKKAMISLDKYEQLHVSKSVFMTLKMFFFIGLMKYSNLVNWWVFVKCESKSSQLKEPKT